MYKEGAVGDSRPCCLLFHISVVDDVVVVVAVVVALRVDMDESYKNDI